MAKRLLLKNSATNGNGVASRSKQAAGDGARRTRTGQRSKPSRPARPAARKKVCYASIFPGQKTPLPEEFVTLVRALEAELRIPLWFIIQSKPVRMENGQLHPHCRLSFEVFKAFQQAREELPEGRPVGLIMESPGGDPHFAFRISRLFQRRASEFTVVIPQYAKSAATLLALGAHKLLMARQAELGPLDVQIFDDDRENYGSALNAVQSLERLNAFSMTALDQMMLLLKSRFGRKFDVSLPLVLEYATKFARPLLEKIDTVDYVKKSRELKVAEEYATRLMMPNYPLATAKSIARKLVEMYPTHGFVIDREEAQAEPRQGAAYGLGLKLSQPSKVAEAIMRKMVPHLDALTVIGKIKEVTI